MPKDMSAEIRISPEAGKPVTLPDGSFIAHAEMSRAGADLHLTSHGQTIVIEGYFSQSPVPDLVSPDGARLTPQMVNAFVPPEHAGQYAAAEHAVNDASPAGKITQVVGEAVIVHADGTRVPATVGAVILQGDVIETGKSGAVNILFADNSTFAISESARMSVDQFNYHAADHSGSSFFSMLQGVFVYTSGLIGKDDPGSVNIETPVGSIGIRGTVIAGHILPAGQDSQITIVDGAITLTNGAGTQELNSSFQTVSLSSYSATPQTVAMDSQSFGSSYNSLSGVAGDTINHFSGGATNNNTAPADGGTTTPQNNDAAPATDATTGSAAPTTTTTQQAAAQQPAPTTTATADAATNTSTAPASSFTTADSGSSSFGSSGTSSFTSGSTTASAGTASSGTGSASGTSATGTGTTGGAQTTTTGPVPQSLSVELLNDTGKSGSDRLTNDATLRVNNATSGMAIQYSVDNGAWSTTTPTGLSNGTHTVSVQQVDANNKVIATSVPLTFTLDTVAPSAPAASLAADTGSSSTDRITSNAVLNVTGIETGATLQYSIDGGATWGANAPTADGTYSVLVRQVDAAGNASTSSASLGYTLDTAAAKPTVSLVSDTGANTTDRITSNPALNVGNVEGGATLQYSTDGGTTWSASVPTADGTYTVLVRQTDTAGNVSASSNAFTYTVDSGAPAALSIALAADSGSSSSDGITRVGGIAVTGMESGATVQYSFDGGTTWGATPPSADGTYNLVARQVDKSGNVSASSSTLTYTLDTAAPGAPVIALQSDTGSSASDYVTQNGTLILSGLESGAAVKYSIDGGATWSATAPTADGTYTVIAAQTDKAGNVSGNSSSFTYTIDTTAPAAPTVSLANDTGASASDKITSNATLAFGGLEAGATVQYSTDGGSTWSATAPGWAQGANSVQVRQVDAAGNASSASAALNFSNFTTFGFNTFAFSGAYNATDAVKTSSGIAEFAAKGTVVGTVQPSLVSGDSIVSYSLSLNAASAPQELVLGAGGTFTTQALSDLTSGFSIDAGGNIHVENPLLLLAGVNPTLTFDITATDVAGNTETFQQVVSLADYGLATTLVASTATTSSVAAPSANAAELIYGHEVSSGDNMAIYGYGGADIIIGGVGNDKIFVADSSFREVDGGGGNNTLVLSTQGTGNGAFTLDMTSSSAVIKNVSNIMLGTSAGDKNSLVLDAQSVYDMTPLADHTLHISTASQNILDLRGSGFTLASGIWGIDAQLTYTATVSGQAVTLVVDEFKATDYANQSIGGINGIITLDDNHSVAPTAFTTTPYSGTTGADFLLSLNTNGLGGGQNAFDTIGQFSVITGNGGADIIIGSSGDNLIQISDASFKLADGGTGYDRLSFSGSSPISLDLTTGTQRISNIEEIDLGTTSGQQGGSVTLDVKSIYDMTNDGGTHNYVLHILESDLSATGASVTILTNSGSGTLTYDAAGSTSSANGSTVGEVHYTGTYGGMNVTLVIHEATASGAGHIAINAV